MFHPDSSIYKLSGISEDVKTENRREHTLYTYGFPCTRFHARKVALKRGHYKAKARRLIHVTASRMER